jgi:hypothetical protein
VKVRGPTGSGGTKRGWERRHIQGRGTAERRGGTAERRERES